MKSDGDSIRNSCDVCNVNVQKCNETCTKSKLQFHNVTITNWQNDQQRLQMKMFSVSKICYAKRITNVKRNKRN